MKKLVILIVIVNSIVFANNLLKEFQTKGLVIQYKGKQITIKREKNNICTNANLNPESLFGGDYAGKDVATVCKKTFVTHVGVLEPMQLAKNIKSVGEVEVLRHILAMSKEPDKYILIDARTKKWYKQITIPTAINLPFNKILYDENYDEDDFKNKETYKNYQKEYKYMFKLLNIKESKKGLDFSKAKVALLFCNGSWCSQSPKAIRKLINLGYPAEKLLWYRGGLQDWLIYNFTVEKK